MSLSGQLLEALLAEGVGEELVKRIESLISSYDDARARETALWFKETFPAVFGSRTPSGMKGLKQDAAWLFRHLDMLSHLPPGATVSRIEPEGLQKELAARWTLVKDHVPELVRFFSNEGKEGSGATVPAELKLDGVTYINGVGFGEKQLKKWATELNRLWDSIKGWRRKAITAGGGLKVKLARPQEFRGTATGKYRSQDDELYVRATPNVLKRSGGTYGAPDYILVHELGHRYEWKVRSLPTDFDKPTWWTSRYSRQEGEAFAELFALGHFGSGIQRLAPVEGLGQKLDRFEQVMAGGERADESARGLWPEVQESEIGHLHLLPRDYKLKKARVRRGDRGDVIARGADRLTGYRSTTRHKTVGGGY